MYRNFKVLGLGFLAHVTPSIFFSTILKREALVYNSYFFLEQPFYGNYSTSDSHTNTAISHAFAYSSRWRRKPWQGLFQRIRPRIPQIIIDSHHFVSQKSWWVLPHFCLRYWSFQTLEYGFRKSDGTSPPRSAKNTPPPPPRPAPGEKIEGILWTRKSTRSIMSSTRKPM